VVTPIKNKNYLKQSLDGWFDSNTEQEQKSFIDKYNDPADWDVSKVTDMSELFQNNDNINIDLTKWDTSNVTDMSYMFSGCINFNQDISKWNINNVGVGLIKGIFDDTHRMLAKILWTFEDDENIKLLNDYHHQGLGAAHHHSNPPYISHDHTDLYTGLVQDQYDDMWKIPGEIRAVTETRIRTQWHKCQIQEKYKIDLVSLEETALKELAESYGIGEPTTPTVSTVSTEGTESTESTVKPFPREWYIEQINERQFVINFIKIENGIIYEFIKIISNNNNELKIKIPHFVGNEAEQHLLQWNSVRPVYVTSFEHQQNNDPSTTIEFDVIKISDSFEYNKFICLKLGICNNILPESVERKFTQGLGVYLISPDNDNKKFIKITDERENKNDVSKELRYGGGKLTIENLDINTIESFFFYACI
jgi:surface protein